MYDIQLSGRGSARRSVVAVVGWAVALSLGALDAAPAWAQMPQYTDPNSVVRKISSLNDKLELTTNTSRILTLDKAIPRVQVNNPELLAVTPLSATQVQIAAKKAGVTQVNLWDEDGTIHTVDVQIYGDARELQLALQTQFPHTSIKVFRYSESLVLTGFVDRPDQISPIMSLAQDYAPKVINNINVGGVQQILLKTRVLEVSRTKLRRLGTDLFIGGSNGSFFATGVSGLLTDTTTGVGGIQSVTDTAGNAARVGIVHNSNAFFGYLDWLQESRVAKILAEPNIVAVSGRPAQFNVGGEIPIVVPQSLGTASIEFKPFGTQIDFLPIVLGNGNIRLEVRPRISEIDDSRSVVIQNFTIPSLTVRQVDTAVEMKAGQTFALAGLVQERTETQKRGLPYISDVPILGVPFRKMEDDVNEIELLIIVTPEFVDAIDPCETPCEGGPGMYTTSPTNRGLYCSGLMEVPTHCNPTQGLTSCGGDNCNCNGGCNGCNNGGGGVIMGGGAPPMMEGGTVLPGGTGYENSTGGPTPAVELPQPGAAPSINPPGRVPLQNTPTPPQSGAQNSFDDLSLPVVESDQNVTPPRTATPPQGPAPGNQSSYPAIMPPNPFAPAAGQGPAATAVAPRPYSPQRQPVFLRNASRPYNPQPQRSQPAAQRSENGLIGPVGYDVE